MKDEQNVGEHDVAQAVADQMRLRLENALEEFAPDAKDYHSLLLQVRKMGHLLRYIGSTKGHVEGHFIVLQNWNRERLRKHDEAVDALASTAVKPAGEEADRE